MSTARGGIPLRKRAHRLYARLRSHAALAALLRRPRVEPNRRPEPDPADEIDEWREQCCPAADWIDVGTVVQINGEFDVRIAAMDWDGPLSVHITFERCD